MIDKPLISICICTYRRPAQLEKLLMALDQQETGQRFAYTIIVVDNDQHRSGESVVQRCAERLRIPLSYGVEPQQNIALARNRSVARSTGTFVAFIDDDEEPASNWLLHLYDTLIHYQADGALGPVIPTFAQNAPAWAVKGGVFHRPEFRTGEVVNGKARGIGNTLVRRAVLQELEGPFRPEFGAGGEDTDLLRRAALQGRRFVWCAEAVCREPVPPERTRVTFQLRRALLRGKNNALRRDTTGWMGIAKSIIAVSAYLILLPLSLIMGSHIFVPQLVKTFDHVGKLAALCGIDLVGDKYLS